MGLFRRARQAVLPPDAAEHLATYGRFEFDPRSAPEPDIPFTNFISKLNFGSVQQQPQEAVTELHALALQHGGWTAVGASCAIDAFFPGREDSPIQAELLDKRLQFYRGLDLANLAMHLRPRELSRYRELFPN